ncbi:aldehyde dehydrogenase family protein [Alienimonas chondri]|uniref:Succinate-semialdehyde dehydrogenase [NADP(+)] GabD n=1 Tax=Alienimonas chondri TaxID=2681879 RepID=A0ABX1VBV0_9PLAN|nr:aldehyde dehydrogenase family protein [Alienimonas chondri]NNJ25585.1 Succinate-semialdehyde dehydrogenase [NADP(+)] GabD [Alienimonas chondri]
MQPLFSRGDWRTPGEPTEVVNPFDGAVIDTVPTADAAEVDAALGVLTDGAGAMRAMNPRDRAAILFHASDQIAADAEEWGARICAEGGKPITEAIGEAKRAAETLRLSAIEAERIGGEVLPIESAPNGAGKLAFTRRVPCGIVAAITPFNFPLNLVCHKVGPAIAAGNAILIKPAGVTPLSALALTRLLLECGLPEEAIACLTGPGGELGEAICGDRRVRKITFTGSDAVGAKIIAAAGVKRVTMELGSNCPVVVFADADLPAAATMLAKQATANAGQVCISVQRVLVEQAAHAEFRGLLADAFASLKTGDPADESVDVGPLIRSSDADRVQEWLDEAVSAGATRVCSGERDGSLLTPTLLDGVEPGMKAYDDELFGPACGLRAFDSEEEAVCMANETRYGLAAGVLTRDLSRAIRLSESIDAGVVNLGPGTEGSGPQYRADLMPYGGLGDSGLGKEGPRYAVEAMTELKCIVMHP